MMLHIDSWVWKICIVLALVGMREFVRLLGPREVSVDSRTGGTQSKLSDHAQGLLETLDSAAIAIGLVLFVIQPFLLQAFFIPSGSMEDTLLVSDRLLVSKLVYRLRAPRFQEVVVFRAPDVALGGGPHEETDFIKRCMGTPGDNVYVKQGTVYHNHVPVKEPYVKWSPYGPMVHYTYDMKIVDGVVYSREYESPGMPGPWEANNALLTPEEQDRVEQAAPGNVPDSHFLMLGDHRNNSNDSHVWGFVPRENVVGKAVCVFWPPTRIGLLDQMSFRNHATPLSAAMAH